MPGRSCRATPYVADGAPRSPMIMAISAIVVGIVLQVCERYGLAPPEQLDTATVAAGLMAAWSFMQHTLARREQSRGIEKLAEARAELPPGAVAADSLAEAPAEHPGSEP